MGLFDFFKKANENSSLPITQEERWYRDTYIIWSAVCCPDYEYIAGFIDDRPSKKELLHRLHENWEVDNRGELLQEVKNFSAIDLYRRDCGWYLCSGIQLLAMGYVAGLIDRDTMNNRSKEIAMIMQSRFHSWDSMVVSYMMGCKKWLYDNYSQEIAENELLIIERTYQILKTAKDSTVYKVEWSFPL